MVKGFSAAGLEKLSLILLSLHKAVGHPQIGCPCAAAFPRTGSLTPVGSNKLTLRLGFWDRATRRACHGSYLAPLPSQCLWTLGPRLVVQFVKVVEPLAWRALGVVSVGWGIGVYSPVPFPVPTLCFRTVVQGDQPVYHSEWIITFPFQVSFWNANFKTTFTNLFSSLEGYFWHSLSGPLTNRTYGEKDSHRGLEPWAEVTWDSNSVGTAGRTSSSFNAADVRSDFCFCDILQSMFSKPWEDWMNQTLEMLRFVHFLLREYHNHTERLLNSDG